MIASKGQLVRLTTTALLLSPDEPEGNYTTARVAGFVYEDQTPGERGVRLDRPLAGSHWYMEHELEEAV